MGLWDPGDPKVMRCPAMGRAASAGGKWNKVGCEPDEELPEHSEPPGQNCSCTKTVRVPQLIAVIHYLYRCSHFCREGKITVNNALGKGERMLFSKRAT